MHQQKVVKNLNEGCVYLEGLLLVHKASNALIKVSIDEGLDELGGLHPMSQAHKYVEDCKPDRVVGNAVLLVLQNLNHLFEARERVLIEKMFDQLILMILEPEDFLSDMPNRHLSVNAEDLFNNVESRLQYLLGLPLPVVVFEEFDQHHPDHVNAFVAEARNQCRDA